jgi:hypothetical protein
MINSILLLLLLLLNATAIAPPGGESKTDASIDSKTVGVAAAKPVEAATIDEKWLRSVPSGIDLAIRIRGIEAARGDLVRFLATLNLEAATLLNQKLDEYIKPFQVGAGKEIFEADTPLIAMISFPGKKGDVDEPLVYAVLFKAKDYATFQRSVTGTKDFVPVAHPEGYETLRDFSGTSYYTMKGDGFVGISTNEDLMKRMVAAKDGLDRRLDLERRKAFLAGDLAIFADVARLLDRFGSQFDERARGVLQSTEGLNQRALDAASVETIKKAETAVVDLVKSTKYALINADAAPEGLILNGWIGGRGVEVDRPAGSTGWESIGKLPADSTFFVKASAPVAAALDRAALALGFGFEDENDPVRREIAELDRSAGIVEAVSATEFIDSGPSYISIKRYQDASKSVASIRRALESVASGDRVGSTRIKGVTFDKEPIEHRGFSLTHCRIDYSLARLPRSGAIAFAMLIGASRELWFGRNGDVVVTVAAPSVEAAKALIDATEAPKRGLGESATFRTIRAKSPASIDFLAVVNLKGLCRRLSIQLSRLYPGNSSFELRALPEEQANAGISFSTNSNGVSFTIVAPSALGPIFNTGVIPLFNALSAQFGW